MGSWPPPLTPCSHPRRQQGPGHPGPARGAQGPHPRGVDSWGMSHLLAAHTCGSKEPSQEQPPRAATFPGLHRSQVLLSPGTHDKEGMARPAVIGGLGEYNGGHLGSPIPPPEPHAMAFLWVVGFPLFGSSSSKRKVRAGLAAPDQASPTPGPPHPQKLGPGGPSPCTSHHPPQLTPCRPRWLPPASFSGCLSWAPHSSSA